MIVALRRALAALVAAGAVLATGCSNTTTIRSDLVLDANEGARIELHQRTQAIELHNDSDATVHVAVLGKKDRIVSDMELRAQERVRLDLNPARAVRFDNDSDATAVVRWTLRNDDRIQYTLAMNPD